MSGLIEVNFCYQVSRYTVNKIRGLMLIFKDLSSVQVRCSQRRQPLQLSHIVTFAVANCQIVVVQFFLRTLSRVIQHRQILGMQGYQGISYCSIFSALRLFK